MKQVSEKQFYLKIAMYMRESFINFNTFSIGNKYSNTITQFQVVQRDQCALIVSDVLYSE